MNFIRAAIKKEPLAQVVLEDGLSTGDLYRHRVMAGPLEKLPNRETTTEEREAAYKEVGVTPLDDFINGINNGSGFQWRCSTAQL